MDFKKGYNISFILYEDLYEICKFVIEALTTATNQTDQKLHRNIIDPFSAVFEASFYNISLTEWLKMEKTRQIQKTFQNKVGEFHQRILGKINGWEDLKSGNIVDIVNHNKKIVAEIKNKFNTTKGDDKPRLYDKIEAALNQNYKGYTAYYVSIINKERVNRPFTPSDNITKTKRPENEMIRHVDGATFYEIVTGEKDALLKLYENIPIIISTIMGNNHQEITTDTLFCELFQRSFK